MKAIGYWKADPISTAGQSADYLTSEAVHR
jgi:hypothetical protein